MLTHLRIDSGQAGRHVQFEEDDVNAPNLTLKKTNDLQTKETEEYTIWGGLRATLFASWITSFLVPAVPAGFAVKYTNQSPVITFCVNFVAILPLGQILDAVTKEMVIRRGGHEGMLIVVTFGYA